jgi:mercuric ion binding protein
VCYSQKPTALPDVLLGFYDCGTSVDFESILAGLVGVRGNDMKRLLFLSLLIGSMAWADVRTVKLSVPSMNCTMCPITMRKALEKVDGVTQAEVDYETKSAVVTYDDQKANVDQLTKATQDAGYPSTEIKTE